MMQFEVRDEWEAKIRQWQEEHKCKFRVEGFGRYAGCCGGADSFTFTPTTIGMCLTVRCACGAELRLNDF